MQRCVYILLLVSGLIACSHSSQTQQHATVSKANMLRGEAISTEPVFIRYPFRVAVKDSIAVVMDLHCDSCYFQAFAYPSWKPIAAFGKHGEAPDEMLSADKFQFDSLDSIWTLDANRMEIRRWAIIPKKKSVVLKETITLDKNLVRTLDFYRTDSCFLVPGYMGDCRFLKVACNGRPIKCIGKIPCTSTHKNVNQPALAQAWRSFTDYNPRNGIYAMVTQLGEVLEIYNLKTNFHVTLFGPNGEPQFSTSGNHAIPDGIMGFLDVKVTDHYIYTVFQGTSFKDIDRTLQEGRHSEQGGRNLYVFSLNGKPVRQYILDRPICGIDVNEKTHIIIATCVESNQPIVKYII